jgi:hypothetical protein
MFSPIVDENMIVYDRFVLPKNYTDNLEAFLRKNRARTASFSATPSIVKPVTLASSTTSLMAKSLRDYSTPAVANIPVGPTVNTSTENFEFWTGLITMV